jgi:hypothetical protein
MPSGSQHGSDPPFTNEPQYCPTCGTVADEHESRPCLDSWVHTAFMGHASDEDLEVPAYSAEEGVGGCDIVMETPRWPRSWIVRGLEGGGFGIGERIPFDASERTGPAIIRYVARADDLPLAVCRAAVCAPPWGQHRLELSVPFPPR